MTHVSIIGTGNMGQAIAGVVGKGGNTVQLIGQNDQATQVSGDIVVLAVPYAALPAVLTERGESVYGKDPDGNQFEVMWMLPKAEWGAYETAAPVDRLDLPGEVRRWAGVRTAAELVPVEA